MGKRERHIPLFWGISAWSLLQVLITELGFPVEGLQPFFGSRVSNKFEQQQQQAASSKLQQAVKKKVFLEALCRKTGAEQMRIIIVFSQFLGQSS